ncbi:hypothetical protein, partial [Streptomyces umbrinus]|uniref:hypothetical protein n=1 Tax=Streptomyces umbrinus TaxID=67370 RepID=UPI0033E920B8
MSRQLTLRFAVLTAVATGAMLVPVGAAVADDPTPTPTAATGEDKTAAEKKAEDAKKAKELEARKAAAAKDLPKGGVAAGEAPAGDTGTGTLV